MSEGKVTPEDPPRRVWPWALIVMVLCAVTYASWLLVAPFSRWMLLPLVAAGVVALWYWFHPEAFFRRVTLIALSIAFSSVACPSIRVALGTGEFRADVSIEPGTGAVAVGALVFAGIATLLEYLRKRLWPGGGPPSLRRHQVMVKGDVTGSTVIAGDQLVTIHNKSPEEGLENVGKLVTNGLFDDAARGLEDLERSWASLSNVQKFRHRRLQGIIQLQQGNLKRAAERFLEAFDYAPNDEKARTLQALAHSLKGERERAHALSGDLRAAYPSLHAATAIWLRTAPIEAKAAELLPPPWSGLSAEVAVALAERLERQGQRGAAERVLLDADQDEKDHEYWHALGCAILRVQEEVMSTGGTVEIAVVRRAVEYLHKALSAIKGQAYPAQRKDILLNLAVAHHMLREPDEERDAIVQASALAPADSRVQLRRAAWYMDIGNFDQAIQLFEDVHTSSPEATLMLAFSLCKRRKPGDFDRARDLVRPLSARSDLQSRLMMDSAELLVDIPRKQGRYGDAIAELPSLRSTLGSFRTLQLEAQIELERGNLERASEIALAMPDACDNLKLEEQLQLGMLLGDCNLHEQCFDVLESRVNRTALTAATVAVLEAAQVLERFEFLVRLSRDLRVAGVRNPSIVDIEAVALARQGDIAGALEVLQLYLEDGEDPNVRLRMSSLAASVGKLHLVERDVQKLPSPSRGMGERASMVVQVLRSVGEHKAALDFAYRNLRLNRDDVAAFKAIIDAFLPAYGEVPPLVSVVVAVDAAVKYKEIGADESEWVVIETDAPDPTQSENGPDHPFVVPMLGKRVGEEFTLDRPRLPGRSFVIEEINHKYVYCYHRCLEGWERRFPHAEGMYLFRLPKTVDGLIAQLRPILEERARSHDEALALYAENSGCTIHMLAGALGANVFDAIQMLAASPAHEVRATNIAPTEHAAHVEQIRGTSELILEATALGTLLLLPNWRLLLDAISKPMAIPRATLESLRVRSVEFEKGASTSLGAVDGKIYRHEIDAAAKGAYLEHLAEVADELGKRCDVFVGDRELLAHSDWDLLTSAGGAGAADCLSRALKSRGMVWTDDAMLGFVMREKGGAAIWTQAVGEYAGKETRMEEAQRAEIGARLVGWKFVVTQTQPSTYTAAARIAAWNPDRWPMPQHLELFLASDWPDQAVVLLCSHVLKEWWRNAPNDASATTLTVALLERVASRVRGNAIISVVYRLLAQVFGLDVLNMRRARRAMEDWARTRILRPT